MVLILPLQLVFLGSNFKIPTYCVKSWSAPKTELVTLVLISFSLPFYNYIHTVPTIRFNIQIFYHNLLITTRKLLLLDSNIFHYFWHHSAQYYHIQYSSAQHIALNGDSQHNVMLIVRFFIVILRVEFNFKCCVSLRAIFCCIFNPCFQSCF